MFIIFPFEVDFYRKHGMDVEYLGNPLVDEIERKKTGLINREEIKKSLGIDNRPVIALLAGSRTNEIKHNLPEMLKVIRYFPDYQFVLAGVSNIPDELYIKITASSPVTLIKGKTYEILSVAEASLVTSGTATLETALIGVPQVVCFKGDNISMLIARIVIKVKFISLVNLILNREAIRELIQFALNERNLLDELKDILPGGAKRGKILADYDSLRNQLGPSGASFRIASKMVDSLKSDSRR
jgi:lipid-A-disaccharide synthase